MARGERDALDALGLDGGGTAFRLDADRLREHVDAVRAPVGRWPAALDAVSARLDEVQHDAVAAVEVAHRRAAESDAERVAAEAARRAGRGGDGAAPGGRRAGRQPSATRPCGGRRPRPGRRWRRPRRSARPGRRPRRRRRRGSRPRRGPRRRGSGRPRPSARRRRRAGARSAPTPSATRRWPARPSCATSSRPCVPRERPVRAEAGAAARRGGRRRGRGARPGGRRRRRARDADRRAADAGRAAAAAEADARRAAEGGLRATLERLESESALRARADAERDRLRAESGGGPRRAGRRPPAPSLPPTSCGRLLAEARRRRTRAKGAHGCGGLRVARSPAEGDPGGRRWYPPPTSVADDRRPPATSARTLRITPARAPPSSTPVRPAGWPPAPGTASVTAARRATRTAVSSGRSASRAGRGGRRRQRAARLVHRRRGEDRLDLVRVLQHPQRRGRHARRATACGGGRAAWPRSPRARPGRCRATPSEVSTDADWRTWSRRSRSAWGRATCSGAGPGSATGYTVQRSTARPRHRPGTIPEAGVGEQHALARAPSPRG